MDQPGKDEIRAQIRSNLDGAGIADPKVIAQADPFRGWRIAVIAEGFERYSQHSRRQMTLAGLEQLEIAWLDLLTPAEQEWAGPLPNDLEIDDLPLWAESLGRARTEPPGIHLPSDLDEDLERPIIATFYSLRGGVGRSTALAHTGRLLAEAGRRVVCVDMDLEAPGLGSLFGVEDQISEDQGVVPLLVAIDAGGSPELSHHLIRIDLELELYVLPAGRPTANYARRLRQIDPVAWYSEDRNPLRILINDLGRSLPFTPDVLLLDARTGINPISGPLLFDLADLAIVVFFPHPQARTGTSALVQGLLRATTQRSSTLKLAPEPRFIVSPLPASKAPEVVARYEDRAHSWIRDWLSEVNEARIGAAELERAELEETDITHFIRYREDLATSDRVAADPELDLVFGPIAEWISGFLPTEQEARAVQSIESSKRKILDQLDFPSGIAESQPGLREAFVTTENIKRALDPEIPLVIGRKGTGKTAIFRWLSEDEGRLVVPVNAPAPLRSERTWMLNSDGFEAAEKILQESDRGWHLLWAFLICVAFAGHSRARNAIPASVRLGELIPRSPGSMAEALEQLRSVAARYDFGIRVTDLLTTIDRGLAEEVFLVFDGLDSGFGHTDDGRRRRREAVEGLFALWVDQVSAFKSIRFKVLLREDIWRDLRFENKSHLHGRSVALRWKDQTSYLRVAIKHALKSSAFTDSLGNLLGDRAAGNRRIEHWNEEDVRTAWNLLVGERMKGGKTTFTRNWVWNRLADANDDHTPRYLLQLFEAVTDWERTESRRSGYPRSIIRPRALERSLPDVSDKAFQALREEFPELGKLFDRLQSHPSTPVPASVLKGIDTEIELAIEVGLLGVHEESGEQIKRYRVPDIYRHALQMKRRGPV